MYLRITSKCNMKCGHCCFSCEPGKGEHMTMETFHKALPWLSGHYFTIGGGEPTIHPDFDRILIESLSVCKERQQLCVITNGTHKQRSLALAYLAYGGAILAELSQDSYHDYDMVSDEVRKAFGVMVRNADGREVVTGRFAEDNYMEPNYENCVCSDRIIEPNGLIRYCGCDNSPIIGNVDNGIEEEYLEYTYKHDCWNDYLKTVA